jgi:hypothetical protein
VVLFQGCRATPGNPRRSLRDEDRGGGTLPRMARRRLRARVNWAMRWGGLAASVALIALIALSAYRSVGISVSRKSLPRNVSILAIAQQGTAVLQILNWPGESVQGVVAGSVFESRPKLLWRWWDWRLRWGWPFRGSSQQTVSIIEFPLWAPALLSSLATTLAWVGQRRGDRSARSPCPSCRYDLSGLPPGSPCPECAAPVAACDPRNADRTNK